tara:strand:+ start:20537 stop:21394 length:858 start_codon:yes stop_codon:yes gene_type:complete
MGGTRFVGKSIVEKLLKNHYQVTVFTRGNVKPPLNVDFIKGDRNSDKDLTQLIGKDYDFVIDSSGRNLNQTKDLFAKINIPKEKYIYISSAGVYKDSYELPLTERSELDPNSRHYGKAETEEWLINEQITFTSFRPTYIYGPGNYNNIENWFFSRIKNGLEIPIPEDGNLIYQLGHVSDLSDAVLASIITDRSNNKIYNCSGRNAITINGILEICSSLCNINVSSLKIKYFKREGLNINERKEFPFRLKHYYTDISRIMNDLNWRPKISISEGLKDSYYNDFMLD